MVSCPAVPSQGNGKGRPFFDWDDRNDDFYSFLDGNGISEDDNFAKGVAIMRCFSVFFVVCWFRVSIFPIFVA